MRHHSAMRVAPFLSVMVLMLAGCADFDLLRRTPATPQVASTAGVRVFQAGPDTIRPAPRPVRTRPVTPVQTGEIGRSTVSLGSPTAPGLWIETALVRAPRDAIATHPDSGRTARVELRPGPPGGARASLQTMLALGLSPAALAEVILTEP